MALDLDKICTVLDKLTIDALTLMEEHIQVKLEIEKSMNEGESHLVKSRYIKGQNFVSQLQLPTEDSNEFDALAVVHPEKSEELFNKNVYDLEIRKCNDDEKLKDPIRRFGVLVPQNLYYAQSRFKQALLWVVKCVNVQNRLKETCIKIAQLKEVKSKLITVEE